jgi:hypothetical protein
MPHMLNALLSVLVVAGLLAGPSLRPGLGLLLGLTGSTIANQVVWLASPGVWSHVATPWLASVAGALGAVVVWSLVRTSPTVAELVGADDTRVSGVGGTSGVTGRSVAGDDETDRFDDEDDTRVDVLGPAMGTSARRGRGPDPTRPTHVRTLGR